MNRYRNIREKVNPRGKRYYVNSILPVIPLSIEDTYIITDIGDRLDNLSQRFYKTTQFWWVISAANPNKFKKSSYFVEPGIQIRIPANPQRFIDEFNGLNSRGR